MKAFSSATTFHVSELEASLRFYIEVLGFTQKFRFGNYAGVQYGEVQIHLSGPGVPNKRQVGQGSIYIFCDEVDEYYHLITSRGAVAQNAPRDYDYGMRDFVIEDPDLNLVAFGHEVRP
ncbi:Uncharacterized conserved protein PhnB, glyoxalase superfamily [Prosthecobacter debontii]|uniref:Uncharacterized conserved protein PhnB, glyoxalase superfamily n=1 Tax=Prosthecobacter debontii TaxID=48467 RepID=A0A1T4XT93_9BACT|nr:VOC family protein [Prosthecobacter debontii]SKA92750.1 Uncharacterized conserved protein PhnB, glyoxalase superfamily [Prosthecobacter debontii]